jgi:2-haloacid dehalogenase
MNSMTALPPHADTAQALSALRTSGFRLGTLSNGSLATVRSQLDYAELTPRFDEIMSAEEVERSKPAPEPYAMAAACFGVRADDVCLVAAHAGDIAGASATGCTTAFVTRRDGAP